MIHPLRALFAALALFFIFASTAHAETRKLALVIGNGGYSAAIGVLTQPMQDAARVGAALKGIGFETRIVSNLDRASFDRELAEFTEQVRLAGEDTLAFVYYSGHGAAVTGARGDNYLLPVGVPIASLDDLAGNGVRLSAVIDNLRATHAKASFIVIDACRNNFLPAETKAVSKGLNPVAHADNMLVAFATRQGATAPDTPLFSTALAEELPKPGRDYLAMFKAVQRRVAGETRNVQLPYIEDGVIADVCLADCSGAAPQPISATTGAAPVASTEIVEVAKFALSRPEPLDTFKDAKGEIDDDLAGAEHAAVDGDLVAVGYGDGAVHVWRISSRALVASFKAYKKQVTAIAINAALGLVITGAEEEPVRLWSITSKKKIGEGSPASVDAEAVGIDAARQLAFYLTNYAVEFVRVKDFVAVNSLDVRSILGEGAYRFDWDARSGVAVIAGFTFVAQINLRTQAVVTPARKPVCERNCSIAAVAVARDGAMFALATQGDQLAVYNRSGSLVGQSTTAACIDVERGGVCDVRGLALMDSGLLAVVGIGGTANLFSPADFHRVRQVRTPSGGVNAAALATGDKVDTLWLAGWNSGLSIVQFAREGRTP